MPTLSIKISTQNPKALRRAARIGNLLRKYHAFWASHLQGLARAAHKKAQAHEGAAEDCYDEVASLHRRADYLEAAQREKDAEAVLAHLSALHSNADAELMISRSDAAQAARALPAEDIEALGI